MAEKVVERSGLRTPFKSSLDSAYAGGDPKTLRPGEAAAGTDAHKVLAVHCLRVPVASADVLEVPVSNEEMVVGSSVSLSAGLRGTGAYFLLPNLSWPEATALYGSGVTTNSVIAERVYIPVGIKVATIHIEVTTGAASALASVGLYSGDGALLVNSGTFDCATTGAKSNTLGAAVDVDFGWYWYAVVLTDNTIRLRASSTGTVTAIANAGTVQRGNGANAATAGVLPATLGTVTGQTFTIMALSKFQA